MYNSILEWVVYLFYFWFFMSNKCETCDFGFFFIFKYSDIGLLWYKITIFIIEITIILFFHRKYGSNNPYCGRLGLKSQNLHFTKFIAYTNIEIHVTGSLFGIFFFMLVTTSSTTITNNWNLKKSANYRRTVSLKK